MNYHLFIKEGNQFVNAVFNETVSIVELDEGLDGETFFLYVLLAAVVVLLVVGAQQFIASKSRKHSPSKKIEMGTTSQDDIDYSWIPKETLEKLSKFVSHYVEISLLYHFNHR